MKISQVSFLAVLAFSGVAQAAGDVEAGQAKSAICVACHGPGGNSTNPVWPKLAGQHPEYIKKQLHDFKVAEKPDRTDTLMTTQAMLLNDQDIENVAAYFSTQAKQTGSADPKLVKKGEQLYRAGNANTSVTACTSCHGPTGAGNPSANFPALNGQHAAYVVKALKDFRDGKRKNDPNKMMRDIASRMTDKEIAAVAQYIQGLH